MEISLLPHFLPQGLLNHFSATMFQELCFLKDKTTYFQITLEEQNTILLPVDSSKYESKGFTEVTIQDFPIRGKAVYLVIRRRRWRHKQNPKDIIRNDSFAAAGRPPLQVSKQGI
jgi:hypothetical protein